MAHIARVYDYWLGGKDNFAVDRVAAERVIAANPDIVRSCRGNRAFLGRVVRFLAGGAAAAQVLDFSRPVAVLLVAILQHISDHDDPHAIVARLMAAVPPGSYLALSHPARDLQAAAMAEIADRMNELVAEKVTFRTQAEVLRFFDGLELITPGLVPVPKWRPESDLEAASPTVLWGGAGRKT